MKKTTLYSAVAVFILSFGVSFFMKNLYLPETIVRTAIKESELTDKSYILCRIDRVTGFDWLLMKNENGERVREYCNIIGSNPFNELKIKYEFEIARNTFVFYVEEKRMSYSDAIAQDATEYVVTGWDILYPVKRDGFDLFGSKKYITKDDLQAES